MNDLSIVMHRPTARQRIAKHARNTHAANNTGEVFSVWSAPCPVLGNRPTDICSDSRGGVFYVVRAKTVRQLSANMLLQR
jgi:hypothetical protein